jgi:O-antigen ligase
MFRSVHHYSPNFIANASNQILQTATDGGVIAVVAFVTFVVAAIGVFRMAAKEDTDRRQFFVAGLVWLMALVVGNQTAAWLLPGGLISHILYVMIGLAVAARHVTSVVRLRVRAMVPGCASA